MANVVAFFEASQDDDESIPNMYTDADGVQWRKIRFPNFRESACPSAWRYASDQGQLLSKDLRTLVAQPGKGYVTTTLPLDIPGTYAARTTVSLHRVIAFTFHGPPPAEGYTVDHVNRVREDNRILNLQWASPGEQMANRERSQYLLRCPDGTTYVSLHELAERAHANVATLSCQFRHASPGDVVDVQGLAIRVEAVSRTPMDYAYSSSSGFGNYGKGVRKRRKQRDIALEIFVQGKRVAEVADAMGIQRSTVLSYVGVAAREGDRSVACQLATRLGLTCPLLRKTLADGIRQYHQTLDSSADYMAGYQAMVMRHLPGIGDDWPVIKHVFQALHHLLQ